MAKNIEMNYKQGESEYEVLYPNVKVESVIDIEEHYYTKNEINGQISDIIPNPYGVLAIKATDDEGNPVSVQLTVNPQIDGSGTITTDSGSGLFVAFVNPATYNLTAPAGSDFIEYNIDIPSAQVKTNQVTNVNVGVNVVQSGELEITSSRTIQFPANFNIPVDIWGCGGGGGGGLILLDGSPGDYNHYATGGSGGYTVLKKNFSVANETLKITIGSGGNGGRKRGQNYDTATANGGDGGGTSIEIVGKETLTAKNGRGAYAGRGQENGKDGGSGSGGCYYTATQAGSGGSDGGDGTGSATFPGGKGQGTTTRKFGESDNTLYCSGSGGCFAMAYASSIIYGSSGSGAGNRGSHATTYGSAGGSWGEFSNNGQTYRAGNGKQGVVFIRWPSQST